MRSHGKRSTYKSGCRCNPCTASQRDYMRDYQRQTKEIRAARSRDKRARLALPACIGCGITLRLGANACRQCGALLRAMATRAATRRKRAERRLLSAASGTRGGGIFTSGPCAWCGTGFVARGSEPARYCSPRCKQRNTQRGFKIRPSERLAIYERDAWTCQLCEESVDRDLMTLDPSSNWAPTLDHVIPQSKGGAHDPENLRLAHRWCNSVRGDETYYTADDLRAAA